MSVSASAAASPVVFLENWEGDVAGNPLSSPWYVDPHMTDGGLTVIAGSDYSFPFTGGNQGLLINQAGFNGKDAGNQALLAGPGLQVQVNDANKLIVQYYAKGLNAKHSEWYLEICLGDVHAPRVADLPPGSSLPSPIPVVAYCKPFIDEHHTMYYFDGRAWTAFGALDFNLTWQKPYMRLGANSAYLDCSCNNSPVDLPRQYLGDFDRVSINTRDALYSEYTVIDDVSITGGSIVPSLNVAPSDGLASIGPTGGPFSPQCKTYTLTNTSLSSMDWAAIKTQNWLDVSPSSGTLAAGASVSVDVCINAAANALPLGQYSDQMIFRNVTSNADQTRAIQLYVGQIDSFTEQFTSNNDLNHLSLTLTPDASPHSYHACTASASQFPTIPQNGTALALSGDNFVKVTLQQGAHVSLYGAAYSEFYVGANGYITFDNGDTSATGALADHFQKRRISGLFTDLAPQANQVSWKQLMDRVAITYQNVAKAGTSDLNSFQFEMFYDGRIRLTWLDLATISAVAGLSKGQGTPINFHASDLSGYSLCPALHHRADFDGDGDVDQSDFAHLQTCLASQSGLVLNSACADGDLNMDGEVGLPDVTLFIPCLSGTDVPAAPGCLP